MPCSWSSWPRFFHIRKLTVWKKSFSCFKQCFGWGWGECLVKCLLCKHGDLSWCRHPGKFLAQWGAFLLLLMWRGDERTPWAGPACSGELVKDTCPKTPGWRAVEEDFQYPCLPTKTHSPKTKQKTQSRNYVLEHGLLSARSTQRTPGPLALKLPCIIFTFQSHSTV